MWLKKQDPAWGAQGHGGVVEGEALSRQSKLDREPCYNMRGYQGP